MRWIRGTVVRVAKPGEPGLIHADGRMLPYRAESNHPDSESLRRDMAVEFTVLADGFAVGVHSLAADLLAGLGTFAGVIAAWPSISAADDHSGEGAGPEPEHQP